MKNRHPFYYGPAVVSHNCRSYGLSNLVGDITLTVMTAGVWAIWWVIREVSR